MLGRYKRHFLVICLVSAFLILLNSTIFAASTGKIKGTILDDKGEAVIGASVLVKGTTRGAMTDFDGKYIITQMEPGIYTLLITHLEFTTVEITDIQVKADITSEANQELSPKATDIDKIIKVKGKQDQLKIYETANQQTITKEEIEKAPVTTVDDLLTQVAGVVTNTQGEIFIRGGRAGEVSYIVDGVPINDPLGSLGQAGAQLSLVSGSIQEIQIIKDGFDPEYGDALSGIVKITTRTGSKDNTVVNMQFITDDFGNPSLNKYSRNNDYVRFSFSGPDPIFKSRILPALGLNFLEDKEFTYYLYAEIDKSDGITKYSDYDTPGTVREYDDFNLMGIKVPERRLNRYYWMGNIKFRPRPNLKFILSYNNTQQRNTAFSWGSIYSAQTVPVYQAEREVVSLEVSQAISKDMTYEAVFSYAYNSSSQKPGDPNHPGNGLDPDQFMFDYEWEKYEGGQFIAEAME